MDDSQYLRMLIGDTSTDPTAQLFSDDEVAAILSRSGGNVLLAAASALDMIAINAVLLSRKIRTQDLETDGPAVSAELRALARQLRDQAADKAIEDDGWGFEVINYGQPATATELINPQTVRVPRW